MPSNAAGLHPLIKNRRRPILRQPANVFSARDQLKIELGRELYPSRKARDRGADAAERGTVRRRRRQPERCVVGQVLGVHSKIEAVALSELELFRKRSIGLEGPRTNKVVTSRIAERSRLRLAELICRLFAEPPPRSLAFDKRAKVTRTRIAVCERLVDVADCIEPRIDRERPPRPPE